MHFRISEKNVLLSWVTAVYGRPNPSIRKHLYVQLGEIAKTMQEPWLIGGDFNTILYRSEKKWGSFNRTDAYGLFHHWFHSNKLHDLQFKGSRFTWARGFLFKRLDRAICNDVWF